MTSLLRTDGIAEFPVERIGNADFSVAGGRQNLGQRHARQFARVPTRLRHEHAVFGPCATPDPRGTVARMRDDLAKRDQQLGEAGFIQGLVLRRAKLTRPQHQHPSGTAPRGTPGCPTGEGGAVWSSTERQARAAGAGRPLIGTRTRYARGTATSYPRCAAASACLVSFVRRRR